MYFSNLQNKITAIWLIFLVIIALGLGWTWIHKGIHIQTNIFALLPKVEQDKRLEQTETYVSGQLNNKVFLVIDTQSQAQLEQATQLLQRDVSQSNLFQPLKPQVDTEKFAKTLYVHRAGLMTEQDEKILTDLDYLALTEQSLMQIMSPGMPVTEGLLKQDPLLLFPRYAMGLAGLQHHSNIEILNGFATIADEQGYSRLFNLTLSDSPYDVDYQEKTAIWMQGINQKLQAIGVKTHWTGTIIFSHFGTQSAKNEISTIGIGSSLGVLLLVWFGFRSIRPMLTELIAVTTGSMVAFAITHWMFSEIHLMTLVFGASLIGVCVDFSFYFMAMQSQQRHLNGFAVLKPILPSLFIGLSTTLLAYLFLSFTPFPGFKQIAVFSMVGLTAAGITSLLLLPRLPALNAEPAIRILSFIEQCRNYFLAHSKKRYALIFLIFTVSASSLFFLKSNDEVRNLQSMDQHLKQEDQYVHSRFGQEQGSDYFVIYANTNKEVEDKEQFLIHELSKLQHQGKIQAFQAIGQTIPSIEQQQNNIRHLQNIPKAVLVEYANAMQLDINDVLNWQKKLQQQPLLSLDQFIEHPLAFLQVNPQQRLILIQGIRDPTALNILQTSQIKFVRPIHNLSTLFQDHRVQAERLFIYALIALSIGLTLIYGIRSVFALMVPVILALMSTFALQAWMGVEINLFSVMGVFLILGIGVDYAIFYRQGHDHPNVVGMALFLCMMSTLLGFGLLSLSQTYAIHCFGLTVLFGVIFSFIYATIFTQADPKLIQQVKNQS
ncbi:acyl-sn-glycerol-3-phosphate acyltransferase [Acinetobacter bereziniae]|uniref:MMPL family transporter n=1 Tax=Acinetobacter bereziniae TaxID=106648 RepID=UPI001902BEC7|nr:hypothetical protein [Acinetobacter bereziniae]MBJ8452341.1 acyl-sn-glycerol-3-phosphate acyltransferase [Acinetobacter bereziniae]MBJ8457824.1 acyl-sn-glycerol-3-phosphate acyltransferase [Acinetobacter bereziniae]